MSGCCGRRHLCGHPVCLFASGGRSLGAACWAAEGVRSSGWLTLGRRGDARRGDAQRGRACFLLRGGDVGGLGDRDWR